jgi:hypothetical protein
MNRKFLTLSGFEIRPFSRPTCNQLEARNTTQKTFLKIYDFSTLSWVLKIWATLKYVLESAILALHCTATVCEWSWLVRTEDWFNLTFKIWYSVRKYNYQNVKALQTKGMIFRRFRVRSTMALYSTAITQCRSTDVRHYLSQFCAKTAINHYGRVFSRCYFEAYICRDKCREIFLDCYFFYRCRVLITER